LTVAPLRRKLLSGIGGGGEMDGGCDFEKDSFEAFENSEGGPFLLRSTLLFRREEPPRRKKDLQELIGFTEFSFPEAFSGSKLREMSEADSRGG
jgi:hypothetical protein